MSKNSEKYYSSKSVMETLENLLREKIRLEHKVELFQDLIAKQRIMIKELKKTRKAPFLSTAASEKRHTVRKLGKDFCNLFKAWEDGGYEKINTLLEEARASANVRADAYTALAKKIFPEDKHNAAILAGMAWHIDPRDWRLKWYAFKLIDAGDFVSGYLLLEMTPEELLQGNSEGFKRAETENKFEYSIMSSAKNKAIQALDRLEDISAYMDKSDDSAKERRTYDIDGKAQSAFDTQQHEDIFSYSSPFIYFALERKEWDESYCFRVFRNGKIFHRQEFSSKNTLRLNTRYKPGIFRIIGHRKKGEGQTENISHWRFLNPVNLDTSDTGWQTGISGKDISPYVLKLSYNYHIAFFPEKTARNLFVLLPAVASQAVRAMKEPVFHRWLWALDHVFPGHVLCLSDPLVQIHSSLPSSWFVGEQDINMVEDVAQIVDTIARQFDIQRQNIFFYGSSAGGFSALALSHALSGSNAIAINPQIRIVNYVGEEFMAHFTSLLFPDFTGRTLEENFGDRFDLNIRWKKPTQSRICIVQNYTDKAHYKYHFLPFWQNLGGPPPEIGWNEHGIHKAWIFSQPGGHNFRDTPEMCAEIMSHL